MTTEEFERLTLITLYDPCPHGESCCDDCGELCNFRGIHRQLFIKEMQKYDEGDK